MDSIYQGTECTLHALKIKTDKRSILISAILVALQQKSFKDSYPQSERPDVLMRNIVAIVMDSMRQSGAQPDALKNVEISYKSLIQAGTLTRGNVLIDLVHTIDHRINSFRKTHKYHDVLGRLYIEFMRYANNDKSLGIVLTPPHITDLAVRLVNVGARDVLYDNCAGSGGFLIAGMKRMIEQAGEDQKLVTDIKGRVVGVEIQADIVSLLCSNMFIHGDGRSNVISGNCFDVAPHVRETFKPTKGFLNPPFQSDKGDVPELAYVLNMLDTLAAEGNCACIVPMQAALATSGPNGTLKRQILKRHTLDAVLSLPDELFADSKVGVVVCMMVFTAGQPHPQDRKTWFGYCKDDGFDKKKPHGRIDYRGNWELIRETWVQRFHNRVEHDQFSVMARVGISDEWAAEGLIKTDLSRIEDLCRHTVKDYVAFRMSERIHSESDDGPMEFWPFKQPVENVALPPVDGWKDMAIAPLFDVRGSSTTPLETLQLHGNGHHPYVTTQATNNGVAGYYDWHTERGGVITVESAVLGHATYQREPFSASDHVELLIPRFDMSMYSALFFVALLNAERFRYNYGLKASQTRIKRSMLRLPIGDRSPNWKIIEAYIQSLIGEIMERVP